MAWTIPGWHEVKIRALIESLPKAQRRAIAPIGVSIDERAAELAIKLPPFRGELLPTLERAIFELYGERISRTAWDLRAVPAYLDFTFRVVDDHDHVLATSRDLAELQRNLGARAKEVWATVPRESFERTGLRAWEFGELPESVSITARGRRVLAYPALVETEHAVDLRLLESPAAATAATRDGLRRLFVFALQSSFGKLETQLPGSLAKGPRRELVFRALDEAFALDRDPPRAKAAFDMRLAEGRARLPELLAQLGRLAIEITMELSKVRAALKPLVGKPGLVKAFVDDVTSQLAHLDTPDLWRTTSAARLAHVLRYAKALLIRVQRQAVDPPKDQQKAAQVAPLWQQFVARRGELVAHGRTERELDDFAWLVEELRVQIFAPELKTAVPVSLPRVQELWTSLSR